MILCFTGEFLPPHVGLPLADGDYSTYFMLEIHYDNPAFKPGMYYIFFFFSN